MPTGNKSPVPCKKVGVATREQRMLKARCTADELFHLPSLLLTCLHLIGCDMECLKMADIQLVVPVI
ncbi:hypothetical protein SKAU_G00319770 [Synaphobranchus kaupii]|uniref:Uncharacterized protein n=1 Tax=Synaphobranchus kaupii TaxID=118154 RepID=A0A9Q1ENG6_SYNKA|nr:hypothetical protein SKAU_G00319770 [Synaphobranchus kaupii]